MSVFIHHCIIFRANSREPTFAPPFLCVLLASKARVPFGPIEGIPVPSLRIQGVSKASSVGRAGSSRLLQGQQGPRQHTGSMEAFQVPSHLVCLPLLPEPPGPGSPQPMKCDCRWYASLLGDPSQDLWASPRLSLSVVGPPGTGGAGC